MKKSEKQEAEELQSLKKSDLIKLVVQTREWGREQRELWGQESKVRNEWEGKYYDERRLVKVKDEELQSLTWEKEGYEAQVSNKYERRRNLRDGGLILLGLLLLVVGIFATWDTLWKSAIATIPLIAALEYASRQPITYKKREKT